MNIERVTIGGFLDGLDIELSRGMNVVIGSRGTEKTLLIGLIRFCLNAPSYTESSGERSKEHALAVLGDREVSVTIKICDNRLSVSRSPGSPGPAVEKFNPPIVFSQTDVESLGLQATGRLALIDSFKARKVPPESDEQKLLATIRSFPAIGLFASVMWPIVVSLALNSVVEYHGSFSGILGTGIIGAAIVPSLSARSAITRGCEAESQADRRTILELCSV